MSGSHERILEVNLRIAAVNHGANSSNKPIIKREDNEQFAGRPECGHTQMEHLHGGRKPFTFTANFFAFITQAFRIYRKSFALATSLSRSPQTFAHSPQAFHIHRQPFASFRIHRQQCTRACKRMTLIESKGIIWKVIFHFKLSFNLAFPFKVLAADEWRRCSWN